MDNLINFYTSTKGNLALYGLADETSTGVPYAMLLLCIWGVVCVFQMHFSLSDFSWWPTIDTEILEEHGVITKTRTIEWLNITIGITKECE